MQAVGVDSLYKRRLSGVLVARYRGDSSEAAREHFGAIWRRLREPVLKRAPCEPRIWRT